MIRVTLDQPLSEIPPQAIAVNEVAGRQAVYFADADEAVALSLGGEVFRARDRDPEPVPLPPPIPPVSASPMVAANGQLRVALLRRGVSFAEVDSLIATITSETERSEADALWQYEPYLRRDHALVEVVRVAKGWTEEQVDSLFREAAGLT
jgi:hypothetical protein